VLGRILHLQTALQAAPDEQRLAEVLARGLADVPGVREVVVCLMGVARASGGRTSTESLPPCPAAAGGQLAPFSGCPDTCPMDRGVSSPRISLESSGVDWGALFFDLDDAAAFEPYEPYVANTGNLVALCLDNARHAAALADLNRSLDERARARAEEQRRLAAILEHSDNIAVLKDASRRYLMANPSYLKLTGRSTVADVVGRTDEELFAGLATAEQISEYVANDVQAMELPCGEALLAEERFPGGEGSERVFLTKKFPVCDHAGERLVGVGAITTEITERKRAEAQLELLRSAIDQAAEAVVITDAGGTIQYVNPAFESITGYSTDEVIGENPRILKSGEQDHDFYARMWETLASGETWSGRMVNRRKDGALYTEDAVISPVRDGAGRTINYVAVKRDVSGEIALETQLRQAQKMEAVGQLAGGVAHDFNNLLQVILGYGEMALADQEPGSRAEDAVSHVLKATRQATSLVSQLLAFSRRQVLQMQDVQLNEVIDELLRMLKRVIGEQISLEFRPGPEVGTVHADPTQLGQILANLCVNARDSMKNGGRITIETRRADLDETFVEAHPWARPGPFARMDVADTGCGMSSETLQRIFEPFFTTKEVGDGTGLGLSTAYGLIKQHGGAIAVDSQEGVGTTFRIYLPLLDRPARQGSAEVDERSLPAGAETILVAEDEDIVRDLTRTILENAGYKVITARNGEEALELFRRHGDRIDMALLDVIMPGVDGPLVAERLRRSRSDVPVLYASGYSTSRLTLGEQEALVRKPFSREVLLQKVRALLDRG
jgi:PAS domain S-box-containing protein